MSARLLLPTLALASCVGNGPKAVQLFGAPSRVTVGEFPLDVAIGDLNRDGVPDLVSADAHASALSVSIGGGGGQFQPAAPIAMEAQPHLVEIADVDRDGDRDILATGHDHVGVFVFLGDGAGRFTPAPGSPFSAFDGEAHNHGIAVGDISGDGAVDAVTANQTEGTISVLVNDGSGRFTSSSIAVGADPYGCELGDLDGDGALDVVVPLVRGDRVAALLGDGQGHFTAAPGSPHSTPPRPYAIALADLDGDRKLDVLAAHDDSDDMTILIGGAAGALAARPRFSLGSRAFRFAVADLDLDGDADVVAGAGDRLLLFVGSAGGELTPASWGEVKLGQTWSVEAGDLDGDGRPDLVAPDATANALWIWLSSGR